jgi:AcrR family transcriptional regulator
MSTEAAPLDRRRRRRLETIDQVLDIAVDLMTEQGVAGLSVGEIARRMGIQPPSLYVYFPSKVALYDALFARGARSVLEAMHRHREDARSAAGDLDERLLASARAFLAWCLSHQAYSQLLFWRPVPGFTPSQEAYAPAVELICLSHAWLVELQEDGLLRSDVDVDDVLRDWTVLTSGVFSQQVSNAPQDGLDTGRFTGALPTLVAMFAQHYGTTTPPARPQRSARHADPS